MFKKIIFIISFLVLSSNLFSQNKNEIKNLKALARVYGYVKYFHPSDEAYELNWDKFAIYAADKVRICKTDDELINTLYYLFRPIAPTINFFKENAITNDHLKKINPKTNKNYLPVYWQHFGVGFNMNTNYYKSVRVNGDMKINKSDRNGDVITSIDYKKYIGEKIKFTAWIKLKESEVGAGYLWIGDGDMNTNYSSPAESSTWKKIEVEKVIDSTDTIFKLGCSLYGKGELFFDAVSLQHNFNGKWENIELHDPSFELDATLGTSWTSEGEGYEVNNTCNIAYEGKCSIHLSYIGKFEKIKGKKLFNEEPPINDVIQKEIAPNIKCNIPLVLFRDENSTLPKSDSIAHYILTSALKNLQVDNKKLEYRLGNIINTYNVFQHFYPYFDVVKVDWDAALEQALKRSYLDKTKKDYIITLQKFTAPLKDGHIFISTPNDNMYLSEVLYTWMEGKLVVKQVFNKKLNLSKGDIITHINQEPVNEYFKKLYPRVSAGSKRDVKFKALGLSFWGDKNTKLVLRVNGKDIDVYRNVDFTEAKLEMDTSPYYTIEDSIFYINLSRCNMDTINALLPKLQKSKAIICDLRGRPYSNDDFISYLLPINDTTTNWMQTPQIIYPNHEGIIGYNYSSWELKAKKPYLGNKNIIFLAANGISYTESYLGYIKSYKLATIIGQPSMGANGNINKFVLPGNINVKFTGMKVVNLDGTQFHTIGIKPDIYVKRSIEDFKHGRDTYLIKAIQIIKGDSK